MRTLSCCRAVIHAPSQHTPHSQASAGYNIPNSQTLLIQCILHLSEWLPINIKHTRRLSGRPDVQQDSSLDNVRAKRLIVTRINC